MSLALGDHSVLSVCPMTLSTVPSPLSPRDALRGDRPQLPKPRPQGCHGERVRGEAATAQGQGQVLPLSEVAQHRQLQRRPSPPSLISGQLAGMAEAVRGGRGGDPNPSASLEPPSPSCWGSGSRELGNGNCSRPGREALGRRRGRSVRGVGATSDSPVPASQNPHTAGPE